MHEEWVDLEEYGYPNYKLSPSGKVFSEKLNRLLKISQPKTNKHYPHVNLIGIDGRTRPVILHILLATVFIPGWFKGAEVNHKDGNKLNYSLDNLEWVTKGDNRKHAWENDLHRGKYGKTIRIITPEDRKRGDFQI